MPELKGKEYSYDAEGKAQYEADLAKDKLGIDNTDIDYSPGGMANAPDRVQSYEVGGITSGDPSYEGMSPELASKIKNERKNISMAKKEEYLDDLYSRGPEGVKSDFEGERARLKGVTGNIEGTLDSMLKKNKPLG